LLDSLLQERIEVKMFAKLLLGLGCLLAGYVTADNSALEVRYSKLRKEVELDCPDTTETWKKRYNVSIADFSDVEAGEGVEIEGGKLVLAKLQEEELGVYACLDGQGNMLKQFDVALAFRFKKMPQSVSVDVGTSSEEALKCVVIGERDVIFRWFTRPEGSEEDAEYTQICGFDNDNCASADETSGLPDIGESKKKTEETTTPKPFEERVSIEVGRNEDGNQFSVFKIANAQIEDRAVYMCQAIAAESQDLVDYECEDEGFCEEGETIMRVKDPLAAIWPFAGIVIEVVVLCLVIFICERRKKDEDKDDMDDGYAGNNVSNNSLRQRK